MLFPIVASALAAEPEREVRWTQPQHGVTVLAGTGPAVLSSGGLAAQVPVGESHVVGVAAGLLGAGAFVRRYAWYWDKANYDGAFHIQLSLGATGEPWLWTTRVGGLAIGQTFVTTNGVALDWCVGGSLGAYGEKVPWFGVAAGYSFDTRRP